MFRSISTYDIQTGGNIIDEKLGGFVAVGGSDIRLRCQSVSDNDTIANGELEIEMITS